LTACRSIKTKSVKQACTTPAMCGFKWRRH